MQPFGTVAGRLRRHLARWLTLDRAPHRLLLPFLSPAQPAGLSGHIRSPVREGRHNRMGVPHPASLRRDPGAFSNSWLATATLWPSPTTAFLLSKTAASLFDWRDCAQHSQRKIMTMDAVPSSCGASYSTCYLPAQYPPVRHSGQPFPYSKPPMCRRAARCFPSSCGFPQPCRHRRSSSTLFIPFWFQPISAGTSQLSASTFVTLFLPPTVCSREYTRQNAFHYRLLF